MMKLWNHPVVIIPKNQILSMLEKGYVKYVPLINDFYPRIKFLKVNLKELPMSVLWKEGLKFSYLKEDCLHKDMEDFLFKILGEGFRLDRDVIREVLGKPTVNHCHLN